jgi:hypothetical protein
MSKLSFNEVKNTCANGRFFSYEGFNDRLFVPPAIFLVWVFVRLGWSGNAVSVLSGVVAITGAILISSQEAIYILIGSFGYMIFYLLDYVDGGVARINKQGSISGQYFDWIFHVIAAVGFAAGIFSGALANTGSWVIPFGVLFLISSALALDRYALAWFSICMYRQQQQIYDLEDEQIPAVIQDDIKPWSFFKLPRNLSTLIFHENHIIFLLPVLSLIHFLYASSGIDFRIILVVLGGVLYFPVICYDIWRMTVEKKIDTAYQKLFFDQEKPVLPEDHFFK